MLKLVEQIKQNGLEFICNKYSITAKRHGKYSNLVLLKYDQINSPMGVKIVQQCRGIILDEANDWKIICYTYDKFFNHGEGHAAKIDWTTARVYEKADGSLCQLFRYNNEWLIATSGTPDASGNVNDYGFNFAELFWKVWNELGYKLPDECDNNKCYAFELLTPYNRIVVQHKSNKLILHGARDLLNLKELNPVIEAHYNKWECIRSYPITSLDEAVEKANKFDPLDPEEGEGFVVVDQNFNRLKIKGKNYLAMSHLKESCGSSKRQLLELVRNNEGDEFLTAFEEYRNEYNEIRFKYERLIGKMEGFYDAIKHITERKDFAIQAKKVNYSDALFSMKYGKVSDFKNYISTLPIKSLEKLLELNIIE